MEGQERTGKDREGQGRQGSTGKENERRDTTYIVCIESPSCATELGGEERLARVLQQTQLVVNYILCVCRV